MSGNETISIRVVGDSASGVAATDRARGAVDHLGRSARATSRDFSVLAASARRSEATITSFGNAAQRAGKYVAAAGAFGLGKFIADGVRFQATMEQNRIAFTQFLGSAKAANKELRVLYEIAKTTPFEFADVTLAARKFSAFGFTVKETNELLRTVADTASGLALDKGGIDRMVLAIGQIKSKGILSSQDLRQLQELGAVDVTQLAKDLGLTAKQMSEVGKEGVPARAALEGLKRQWDATFGGQSVKQAQTLSGQLSTLRDNYKQFAGGLTGAAFDSSKSLMGKLNKELGEINDEFRKNPKLTLEARIKIAKEHLEPVAREISKEIGDALERADLGDKVIAALDAAIPAIAKAVGTLGVAAAKAFAKAFIEGDALTKLALGAFFVSKFVGWKTVFAALGSVVARKFAEKFAAEMAVSVAAEGAIGSAVATGAAAQSKWGKLGKVAGKAFGVGIAIAAYAAFKDSGGLGQYSGKAGWGELFRDVKDYGPGRDHDTPSNKQASTLLGSIIGGLGNVTKGAMTKAKWAAVARQAARKAGINPDHFVRQIGVESGFNPNARSPAGALGIAQFMPGTAAGLGINPMNPREALGGAASLMASYIKRYGSWRNALVAYNAGPGRVGGALPQETQDYLVKILGKGGGGKGPIKWSPVGGGDADDTPGGLAWAQSMVGHFKESSGKNTGPELDKLQKEFGFHAAAWCAMFATKSLVKAGFPKGVLTAQVSQINAMAKSGAYGLGFTSSPGPGDLMTFGNQHVGIVEKVNRNKGTVTIIDGNGSSGQVARSTRGIGSGRYISVDAAGAGVGGGRTPREKVPAITQASILAFAQGRIDHYELMVQAGLMSPEAATAAKRKALQMVLPHLKGDTKLQALVSLKGFPAAKRVPLFTGGMRRDLALAYGQKNPGWIPEGGWAKYGQDRTIDNPWLQGSLSKQDLLTSSGAMSPLAGMQSKLGILKGALPFLSGDPLLQAQAAIKTLTEAITDNTEQTRQNTISAIKEKSGAAGSFYSLLGPNGPKDADKNNIASGLFAQFFPGMDFSQFTSTSGYTDFLKGLVPGLIAQGDFGGAVSLLGEIAQSTASIAEDTSNYKDIAEKLARNFALSQAQYKVFQGFDAGPTPYLGGFDQGGTIPRDGYYYGHTGETVVRAGQSAQTPVQIFVSAEASALGVRIDSSQGRNARQLSVAPGGR